MIEAAQTFAREHGRAPAISDWRRRTTANPTASNVQYIFGSWGEFMRAAGLPRNERNRTRWTREAIIDAILEFRFTVGRWPTSADFHKATTTTPCIATVIAAFGTWTAARKAAGYTGLDRAQHRGGETRTCGRCGIAVNDFDPGCGTCRRRQRARMLRDLARRGPAPIESRCSGCGTEMDNHTDGCKACRDRRRQKVAA